MSLKDLLPGLKGAGPKVDAAEIDASDKPQAVIADVDSNVLAIGEIDAAAPNIVTDLVGVISAQGLDEKAIRAEERQRIQAILTHENASANSELAESLAWGNAACGQGQAVKTLDAAGGRSGGLDAAMRGKSPVVGANAGEPEKEKSGLSALVDKKLARA